MPAPRPTAPRSSYARVNHSDDETPIDDLDPLSNPHDFVDSDSEDEEWKQEKQLLRSQNESLAYSVVSSTTLSWQRFSAAAHRVLPPWLLHRRVLILLALAVAAYFAAARVPAFLRTYHRSTVNGLSEPWYPTPRGGSLNAWDDAYNKAAVLVSSLTLLEKINITTGTGWEMGLCVGNTGPVPRLGFPSLCLQDGPLGLRFADNITAGPAGITVGATWNQDLMYKRGRMLGLEARAKGVNVLLGPSVGPLGRIPAGGRNWEAFGVDPVLQGFAAAATVRGVQEEGVMATIKHFVANEQEHYRQAWEWGIASALSSNLDDRTLHEMYAWPFADAIRSNVASVMCSYNQVNNSYACQNSKLLNGILKDEMGFQGFVQSDWLAQRSGVASALAGLDMSMPGDGEHWADGIPFWGPRLTESVLNGTVPVERLDDMVTRIIAAWYSISQDKWTLPPPNGTSKGPNFSSWTNDRVGLIHPGSDDKTTDVVNDWVDAQNTGDFSHSSLARRIAAEGTILLKNENQFLPLSPNGRSQKQEAEDPSKFHARKMKVAVYGEDAEAPDGGPNTCPDRACNRGTLAMGWGSGAVEFPYLVSPWQALQREFRSLDVLLRLWPKNSDPSGSGETAPETQDLCIVFANAAAGEGFAADGDLHGDRNDLRIQRGGEELIKKVSSRCGIHTPSRQSSSNKHGSTIVIIHSVGPVLMESFADDAGVGALLLANLPGQESGNALADVLFGHVNPSGRLPYTIGKKQKDYGPSADILYHSDDAVPQQNFTEGLFIDYRWFDSMSITPRYEFGYGLSYSTFILDNIRISYTDTSGQRPSPFPSPRPSPERSPPSYTSTPLPSPSEVTFPRTWRRLSKFIYPYLSASDTITPDPSPPWSDFPSSPLSPAGGGLGGNPALWDVLATVEVDVRNIDARTGQAVVQLYVAFPQDVRDEVAAIIDGEAAAHVPMPPRVLRGFAKVALRGSLDDGGPLPDESLFAASASHDEGHTEDMYATHGEHEGDVGVDVQGSGSHQRRGWFERPHGTTQRPGPTQYTTGEVRTVKIPLTRRDLSYWSTVAQNWVVPSNGDIYVEVGFSSRDVKGRVKLF